MAERMRLPDTRKSVTHRFEIEGAKGYITAGFLENGKIGEVFVKVAKEGSTMGGMLDTVGILLSMGLQYGVPLEDIRKKLCDTSFVPCGHTNNPDIKYATSLIDYVVRWLERTQCEYEKQ